MRSHSSAHSQADRECGVAGGEASDKRSVVRLANDAIRSHAPGCLLPCIRVTNTSSHRARC
eukprot:3689200-Prymnesium_polylepis.1